MAGKTKDRGYDQRHKDERAKWRPIVERGEAECAEPTCLEQTRHIAPDAAWDLAHDADRTGWRGPAHARCNRSEGSKRRWHGESEQVTTLTW